MYKKHLVEGSMLLHLKALFTQSFFYLITAEYIAAYWFYWYSYADRAAFYYQIDF